jgi:hypothetical protein
MDGFTSPVPLRAFPFGWSGPNESPLDVTEVQGTGSAQAVVNGLTS